MKTLKFQGSDEQIENLMYLYNLGDNDLPKIVDPISPIENQIKGDDLTAPLVMDVLNALEKDFDESEYQSIEDFLKELSGIPENIEIFKKYL